MILGSGTISSMKRNSSNLPPESAAAKSPLVESLGIDVPARRDLLTRNRLSHDALQIGATVPTEDKPAVASSRCSVCQATFASRAELTAHIRHHQVRAGRVQFPPTKN